MKKIYTKFLIGFLFVMGTVGANAQVTVTNPGNTTPGLAATYLDLAAAVTALNLQTAISGPVTIAVDPANPQNAPAGGYTINATLTGASVVNTVTFEGNGNTITASAALTAGVLHDAIFEILGSDFMTIQNFTMLENVANTTTAAATNNMTEWGVALLYASTTNGAQNITIQNNTITLNRTYQNSFGIYSNSTHTSTVVTTSATATTTAGGNSGLKVYGNTISNVNQGICVVGPTAAADHNTGLDIGGAGGGQANSITNWGTTGTFSGYVNVSGTLNCILVRNSIGFNISYNTLTSSIGGNTVTTSQRAIYVPSFSVAPTGTFSNTINNNNISVQSGFATGTINGIINETTTGTTTSSIIISNNNFNTFGHTIAASGACTFINSTMAHLNTTINSNTFTNITLPSTGSATFISNSITVPAGGSQTINNNSIVTAFNKTGAGGTVTCFTSGASTIASDVTVNHTNNNFSNITVTGATTLNGIANTDGLSTIATNRTVTGNIFNNWTGGTSTITVMSYTYWGGTTSTVSNNTITNITGQGTITGLNLGSSGNNANPLTVSSNIINNLSSTGTGGNVTGLTISNTSTVININVNAINTLSSTGASSTVLGLGVTGATSTNVFGNIINSLSGSGATAPVANGITISGGAAVNVYKNKIYDILQSAATGTASPLVNGILLSGGGGTGVTVYNNLVGDLRATASTSTDAIRGISVTASTATTTFNVYYNSVYMSGGGGTNFGSTGIFHAASFTATTAALNLRNNIIVNNTTPNGTGLAVAYRRSAGTAGMLANYASTSNNNLFYAGTPGASNLIYSDGTSSATTMAAYKNGVFAAGTIAPRDASSMSENPPFLSLVGANANFLHIDPAVPTQVESGGANIGGITDDYDGDTRNVTTPDIGADEGTFILADVTGPSISYTVLGNTSCLTDRTLAPVTISDASGVNIAPGTRPRLYYKKSTNLNTFDDNTNATDGWKYVEATGVGGSPFSFTTDYSLLFGGVPVITNVIEYFVVAEDLAGTPNVSINTGTFTLAPTTVALAAANFPVTGTNSYTLIPVGLSGTVTIGAAGTYTSITQAAGLFDVINTNGLSGNLTVNILDATVAETGAIALNVININSCSAGPFTVTIKPDVGVTAVLTGSSATALIKLNGADYVTIDGSNNGTSSRDLTIENTAITANTATIWLSSLGTGAGATNNTIKNTNIKAGSNTVNTTFGIYAGGATITTSATGNDNDDLTIQNNSIQKAYYGIYAQAASTGVNDNLVITGNSIGSNTAADYISFRGMLISQATNAMVSQNTVFNIEHIAINLRGMEFGTGFVSSTVSRNLIYNINYTAASFSAGKGMTFNPGLGVGSNNINNNVIYALKGHGSGTATNNSWGIMLESGAGYNIYFNSVNLSDNRSTTGSTDMHGAMYVAAAVTGIDLRNNVLVTTAAAGNATTGKTYGLYSLAANTAFTTINHNDYWASGTNRFAGFIAATDRITLADMQAGFGQNVNSIVADPMFNSNTNLVAQPGSPLVAAGDNSTGIAIDYLGTARGNPPTIGAYEQVADLTGPVITYNPLNNTLCLNDRTLLPVTITDAGSGVNIAPGTRPRLYYKKTTNANTYNDNTNATDGWKYVEATGVAGSPFSFTTNYLLLNLGVALGDVIQYFVVAEDMAATPNVSINSGVFNASPTSVALTAAAFPITGTINQYNLIAGGLAADVTIGAAGDYPTLTGVGGLFAAINNSGLLNNITARIIDIAITEDGTNSLNGVNYGCLGSYSLLIKPDVGITTVLSGTGATALINLDGADNVTFDGSNNGTSSKDMTIRNLSTTGSTIRFINDATYNTVKNTIVEGAVTSTINGVIVFSTSTGTLGNSNNAITNNDIRERSDAAATIANAIYSSGTVSALNATDTISGNNIFNFNSNGISLTATGIGNNWQLNNNNIYNAQVTPSAVAQNGILVAGGLVHTISGNFVGGNAAGATGTWANSGNVIVTGISITAGVANIDNNTVANITTTNTGTTARTRGIANTSGGANGIVINGNTIFNLSSFGAIASYTGGSQPVIGILTFPGTTWFTSNITNNLVHDLVAENTAALTTSNMAVGIVLTNWAGGCYRNTIYNIKNKSTGITAGQPPIVNGIYARFYDSGYVYNNMISLGEGETNNVQYNGIQVVGAGIAGNDQHYFYNSIRIGGTATGTFSSHGFVRGDNSAVSPGHPVELKNNIFSIVRTGGGSVNYAIASQGTIPALDWNSDYNDLYNSTTANIGYWNATGYNFANWQTTSAGDANSVSVLPNFVSTIDLHLLPNNCGLDGYGTPITGITTDYDVQARDAGAPDMGADEFTATYGTTLAGVIGSAVCDNKNVSALGTTYATSVCDLIANVLPSGGGTAVGGKINVCVTLDAGQQYFNGEPYVQRHHDVLPLTNPTTSTATISLYFTDAEFTSYNTLNPVRPPLPTVLGGGSTDPNRSNVLVTVFFGTPTTTPSAPGFYSVGTRAVINPDDNNITWNGNYWTVTFTVTGFGGYYVHSNIFGAPLPISINYFTGVKQGNDHLLNWKVTCNSTPRATMILERSADSRNFTPINTITADAARCNQPFDHTDAQPLPGMNYYRLKMIDDNGAVSYSGIVALLNDVKGFEIISIAPNPVTTGNFKLNVTSATALTMQVIITDMQGRTVSRQSIPVVAGFSSIPMNAGNLAAGTYTIQAITGGEKSRIIRFVKQ